MEMVSVDNLFSLYNDKGSDLYRAFFNNWRNHMLDLTKITPLRRITKDYTSDEVSRAIEHLTKIKEEKLIDETNLREELYKKEVARIEAVELLKKGGIPIPHDLNSEITFESEMKKRRNQRKGREAVEVQEVIAEENN